MNFVCNGKNNKGIRCSNFISKPDGYCRFHIKLPAISNRNKIILPTPINNIQSPNPNDTNNNIDNASLSNNDIIQDCPICLCEIDRNEEDPGLICKHKFHIDCLNNLQKSECPVCRGPLEFIKSNKVDINKIKDKEKQEDINKKQIQMIEDANLSRTINNQINYNNDFNHNNHNFVININGIFHNIIFTLGESEESEESEELRELEELEELIELEQINRAIENSLITINCNKR